jgi:hypothetical protein
MVSNRIPVSKVADPALKSSAIPPALSAAHPAPLAEPNFGDAATAKLPTMLKGILQLLRGMRLRRLDVMTS